MSKGERKQELKGREETGSDDEEQLSGDQLSGCSDELDNQSEISRPDSRDNPASPLPQKFKISSPKSPLSADPVSSASSSGEQLPIKDKSIKYDIVLMSLESDQKIEAQPEKSLQENKQMKDKPILIKQNDQFSIYGQSESGGWRLIQGLDANLLNKLKFPEFSLLPVTTKGGGDCAFHAILGDWDSTTRQLVCPDIKEKREQVRVAIVNEKDLEFQRLVKAGIQELVMSGREIKGVSFQQFRIKYQQFLSDQKDSSSKLWCSFQSELEDERNAYIMEYIQKNHCLAPTSSLRDQFYDALNKNEGELYVRIFSLRHLYNAFQEYNKLMSTEFDWDFAITVDVKQEYANFLGTAHTWLLPSELWIIAHVFQITVDYYPFPGVGSLRLNPGHATLVDVQFNGKNHFERLQPSSQAIVILPGDQVPDEVYQEITLKKGHTQSAAPQPISRTFSGTVMGNRRIIQCGLIEDKIVKEWWQVWGFYNKDRAIQGLLSEAKKEKIRDLVAPEIRYYFLKGEWPVVRSDKGIEQEAKELFDKYLQANKNLDSVTLDILKEEKIKRMSTPGKLAAIPTKDDENFALHALLGEWEDSERQVLCSDIKDKRENIKAYIIANQHEEPIKDLIKKGIAELIVSGYRSGVFSQLNKNYRHFWTNQIKNNSKLRSQFQKILEAKEHSIIANYIIQLSQLSPEAALYAKFYDALSQDNGKLYQMILAFPELQQAFKKYSDEINIEYDWNSGISQQVIIKAYTDFISSPHVCVLPTEIAIIALIFNKFVTFYSRLDLSPMIFNLEGSEVISVQFDEKNQFISRLEFKNKSKEKEIFVNKKVGNMLALMQQQENPLSYLHYQNLIHAILEVQYLENKLESFFREESIYENFIKTIISNKGPIHLNEYGFSKHSSIDALALLCKKECLIIWEINPQSKLELAPVHCYGGIDDIEMDIKGEYKSKQLHLVWQKESQSDSFVILEQIELKKLKEPRVSSGLRMIGYHAYNLSDYWTNRAHAQEKKIYWLKNFFIRSVDAINRARFHPQSQDNPYLGWFRLLLGPATKKIEINKQQWEMYRKLSGIPSLERYSRNFWNLAVDAADLFKQKDYRKAVIDCVIDYYTKKLEMPMSLILTEEKKQEVKNQTEKELKEAKRWKNYINGIQAGFESCEQTPNGGRFNFDIKPSPRGFYEREWRRYVEIFKINLPREYGSFENKIFSQDNCLRLRVFVNDILIGTISRFIKQIEDQFDNHVLQICRQCNMDYIVLRPLLEENYIRKYIDKYKEYFRNIVKKIINGIEFIHFEESKNYPILLEALNKKIKRKPWKSEVTSPTLNKKLKQLEKINENFRIQQSNIREDDEYEIEDNIIRKYRQEAQSCIIKHSGTLIHAGIVNFNGELKISDQGESAIVNKLIEFSADKAGMPLIDLDTENSLLHYALYAYAQACQEDRFKLQRQHLLTIIEDLFNHNENFFIKNKDKQNAYQFSQLFEFIEKKLSKEVMNPDTWRIIYWSIENISVSTEITLIYKAILSTYVDDTVKKLSNSFYRTVIMPDEKTVLKRLKTIVALADDLSRSVETFNDDHIKNQFKHRIIQDSAWYEGILEREKFLTISKEADRYIQGRRDALVPIVSPECAVLAVPQGPSLAGELQSLLPAEPAGAINSEKVKILQIELKEAKKELKEAKKELKKNQDDIIKNANGIAQLTQQLQEFISKPPQPAAPQLAESHNPSFFGHKVQNNSRDSRSSDSDKSFGS